MAGMRRWRAFDFGDPTFLAIVLSACALYLVTAPWDPAWMRTPTEEPWTFLLLPQALAVVLLRPRGGLAWLSLGLAALMCWPAFPLRGDAGRLVEPLMRLWNGLEDHFIGRAVFWAVAIAIGTTVVRAFRGKDWGASAASAATAMVASLALSEAMLWLASFHPPRSRTLASAHQIAVFVLPALVMPILLWRNWARVVLWIAAPLASLTLTALLVLDERRLTPATTAVAAVMLAAGPVWAYLDWRRTRIVERGRGFEVLLPA